MAEPISIPYYLSAPGGAEGEATLYQVQDGKRFNLKRSEFFFPVGTYFELELTIRHGIVQVLPFNGSYKGDNMAFADLKPYTFMGGEKVNLYYKNTNPTQTREAFIIIHGELE